MEFRCISFTLILPGGYIHVILIVTLGLPFFSLGLDTEMTAAGFVAVEGVDCHEFTYFKEVSEAERLLKLLVELEIGSWNVYV